MIRNSHSDFHRRARTALGLLLALGSISCASLKPPYERYAGRFIDHVTPPPVAETIFNDPLEKRAFNGQPHADSQLDLFGGWSLIEAPDLKRYLDSIVVRLIAPYPHEAPDFEVFINSNRTYSAYATPFADLFVTLGMLEKAESEDEIAFTLAHECAHVLLGHFRRDEWFSFQDEAVNLAGGAAGVAVLLANSDLKKDSGGNLDLTLEKKGRATRQLAMAVGAYFAAKEVYGTLFDPFWNRRQEDEADVLAMDLLVAGGYNASAGISTLGRLKQIEAAKKSQKKQTEDSYRARYKQALVAATEAGASQNLLDLGAQMAVEEGARAVQGVREFLKDKHRLAIQREEDLRGYYRREYQRHVAAPGLSRDAFRAQVWEGTTGTILQHHIKAHEALSALDSNQLEQAVGLGAQSISAPTVLAPFPRYAMYQIRKSQGDSANALLNLEKIQNSPQVSPLILQQLAEEYLGAGRPRDAIRVLAGAAARFDFRDPFLPTEIAAHYAAGDAESGQNAMSLCRESGNKGLVERCSARLPEDALEEESGVGGLFDPSRYLPK